MDNANSALAPGAGFRAFFDLADDVVFMNAASKSALPRAALEAGHAGVDDKGRPWAIDEPGRYVQAQDVRERFARLINAEADDIAIQPAASYGIATAARNLPIKPGQTVVVLEGQFPSNVYAWQKSAEAANGTLITVSRPADGDWTGAVLDALDERTAIAALPPCHWTDGTLLDLARIGARLREIDAAFVVDATQWIGAAALDVRALGVDFLVAAAYKWLLGPYGLSFMYAAPHQQQGQPLEEHLFNKGGLASITSGLSYPDVYTEGARRFDAGEYLNLITLPMIQASLALIEEWQPVRIGDALRPITTQIANGAMQMGLRVADETVRAPHIVALTSPAGFPADILKRLEDRGVYVSARGGSLRVSPYLFNETGEADVLLNTLEDALK